ncbi:hypothetical protein BAE44_0025403 [Dichanthelium oligosanthes]|uniref:Dirigent protein n=1 Tax=Dichanthelium oligosanthes TaxID=888268 RepID=A0A1E5UL32_9POAL|nr:hypothetical protein BAE44_0025403 [Dichanthelium oligosanthes]
MTLYIRQVYSGPNTNQAVVVPGSSNPEGFGIIAVSDWPILDGPGPDAKVVGLAQGLHSKTSRTEFSWYTSMNLFFKEER